MNPRTDGSTSKEVNDVIITGDLNRRLSRAPNYQAENQALTLLAEAMSSNPGTVLQRLVEIAKELTRADSAGISLLEPGGLNGTFRWVATAGAWSPYRDGTMPRESSPCGEVIAREAVLLMKNPERLFPALLLAEPGISEGLLAPFHLDGIPVGTVWTIKHSPDGHFEAEDARILKSLARFASAAHQTVQALKMAEAASQQAEIRVQQLVALAEISTEFIGTCDMQFIPIYGNPAAMQMVGLANLDEVKQTPLREFFFPEDVAFITEEFFPRVLREGQAKVEIRFRHFVTGEPVWVDYSLVVLKDELGRATGLGTVTHDLTQRKRAEIALQVSEARFSALATVGSSSVYRMSPDWREMRHLDGAAFLPDTEKATTDWVDIYIPPDERPRVRESINRAIATKDVFELEHRVLRADGTIGWTLSRAIPLIDEKGIITEWFGAATDVTTRVKKDQSFTRLFQASPAPFLVLKPDAPHFTIAEVNDAYLSATMRTREEVIGRGVFEAYPDNPSDKTGSAVGTLRASLERVLASRQPDTLPGLKYDLARPDGTFEERWWSPINSTVLDEDGKVEALIHNANDITEERQAEIALRESEGRHAFLLKLSDTLRPLRDPVEVQTATMRLVVEHLDVMRASYFKIDPDLDGFSLSASYDRGALPIPDHMRVSDFAPDMGDGFRKGRTFILEDAETEVPAEPERAAYRSIGVRAAVGVPLVKDGLLLGVFGVHSSTPRHWTVAEVQLLEDVADRVWTAVDRAQAELTLRESEERQAFLLKLSDALRAESGPDATANRALRMLFEHMRLNRCYIGIYRLTEDTGDFTHQVHDDRLPPVPAKVRLSDFPKVLQIASDRTLVIEEVVKMDDLSDNEQASFALLGIGALIVATLRKGENNPLWGLVAVSASARVWTPSEVSLVEEVAERTWAAVERARAEERQQESEAQLKFSLKAASAGSWDWNIPSGKIFWSLENYALYDIEPGSEGPHYADWDARVHPDDREHTNQSVRNVLEGHAAEFRTEFRIVWRDGTVRWLSGLGNVERAEDGSPVRLSGINIDITERKLQEEHIKLLMAEVNHRSKNMLSLVQAIAKRTVATHPKDFIDRFSERVQALSASQDLLVKSEWKAVSLGELVRAQLAHFNDALDSRIALEGPQLAIKASASQALGMALHELATNAAKYGALSNTSGRVIISWSLPFDAAGKARFTMSWIESGGPLVVKPTRLGFGSTVIGSMIKMGLGCDAEVNFAPTGLVWRIDCPAEGLLEGGASSALQLDGAAAKEELAQASGRRRVLVVEDESLIAMDIAHTLSEAGYDVIGPANSVAQALALIAQSGCDAAVLDTNLGAETAEPVARELIRRGTPFISTSGYAREQQPEIMKTVPLLGKPVKPGVLIAEIERCLSG